MRDMFNREKQWVDFSVIVQKHITNYTIPQYGDSPEDNASQFSMGDFNTQLAKYVNRINRGGNVRGQQETLRDYLKIAHYACMAYMKMKKELYHGEQ